MLIKNVVKAPNISIGDYTYYDDAEDPAGFEKNNVLFNYPEFGDRLIIGKFCAIASDVRFIMGPCQPQDQQRDDLSLPRIRRGVAERTPPHMDQLPRKGDTVIGNDVWIGGKASSSRG